MNHPLNSSFLFGNTHLHEHSGWSFLGYNRGELKVTSLSQHRNLGRAASQPQREGSASEEAQGRCRAGAEAAAELSATTKSKRLEAGKGGRALLLKRAICSCWPLVFTCSPGSLALAEQVQRFHHLWKFSDLRNSLFGLGVGPLLPARCELPYHWCVLENEAQRVHRTESVLLAMWPSRKEKPFSKIPVERKFSGLQVKIQAFVS